MRKKEKLQTPLDDIPKPILVNLEPVKKFRSSELVGIYEKNYLVKQLKEAFPNEQRLWYVAEYWEWQKVYIDHLNFECEREDLEIKRVVMETHGLHYEVIA